MRRDLLQGVSRIFEDFRWAWIQRPSALSANAATVMQQKGCILQGERFSFFAANRIRAPAKATQPCASTYGAVST